MASYEKVTTTNSLDFSQSGYFGVATGVWTDGGVTMFMDSGVQSPVFHSGLRFNIYSALGFSQDAESRFLDPPVFLTISLRLMRVTDGLGTTGTMRVDVVPSGASVAYSSNLGVGERNEIEGVDYTLEVVSASTLETIPLLVQGGSNNFYGGAISANNGWLALSLIPIGLVGTERIRWSTVAGTSAMLDLTYVPFHTGSQDFPLARRARVVHDFVGGFPYLSDEAVADGFREGVMLHPRSFDPKDRPSEFVPPPGEGVTNDEVSS